MGYSHVDSLSLTRAQSLIDPKRVLSTSVQPVRHLTRCYCNRGGYYSVLPITPSLRLLLFVRTHRKSSRWSAGSNGRQRPRWRLCGPAEWARCWLSRLVKRPFCGLALTGSALPTHPMSATARQQQPVSGHNSSRCAPWPRQYGPSCWPMPPLPRWHVCGLASG